MGYSEKIKKVVTDEKLRVKIAENANKKVMKEYITTFLVDGNSSVLI